MAARRAFRQRGGSDSDDDTGVIVRAGRAAAAPTAKRPVWATHGDDGDEEAFSGNTVAGNPDEIPPQPVAAKGDASSRPTYLAAEPAALAQALPSKASMVGGKIATRESGTAIVEDEDDLSEDVLARKAAAARAHREQQRKRNAFGSLLVSGSGGVGSSSSSRSVGAGASAGAGAGGSMSLGGTSFSSMSRSAAAGAAAGGYDYDSYSDERVSLPAGAADVAALRSALGRGQARPVGNGGRSLALHMDADDHDDGPHAAPAGATAGLRRLGAAPILSALATSGGFAGAPVQSGVGRAPSADAIPAWEAEQLRRAMGGSAAAADAEKRASQTARDLAALKSTSAAVAAAAALSAGPGRGMAVDDDADGDASRADSAATSSGSKTATSSATASAAGRGLGGSAGAHAFPMLPDPEAELNALLRSSAAATARLQEAADSATAAASAAATERTRTAATAASLQGQLSGAAIAYDSYVDLQKTLSGAVAVLRERAPLLQDLIRATALALSRLAAAKAARRRADVVDLLAEADSTVPTGATAPASSCVCAAVGCGDGGASAIAAAVAAARAEAATPPPAHAETTTVTAAMTLLGVSISRSSPAAGSRSSLTPLAVAADVTVAATADEVASSLASAPVALRAERRGARTARVSGALRALCDDACAGRLPALQLHHLEAWDAFDAPDALERALAAACLQPLAAAHSMLFADARAAAAGSVDALLQPFTQWKQGRVARKPAAGSGSGAGAASAAAVPAAVAAGVSAAYVRTFSYLAVQGLCEPLVAHGAWPWLLSSLAAPHVQAGGGTASVAIAAGETIDSLPWFGPLWQYGEVPLAAAAAAAAAAPAAGKQTPGADGDGGGNGAGAETPSAGAPASPTAEVAAAAASDESLLPRLVASALLPAALKLLPAAVDPLAGGATARIAGAGGLLSELHLYDLPAEAAPAIAAAAATALTRGCRSLIVPLILERPTSAPAPTAATSASASASAPAEPSGWTTVDPDADGGFTGSNAILRSARPSPLTVLFVASALRAVHSLVAWRETVPEATLQHLALGAVVAGALRPLMDACLLGLAAEASLSIDAASTSAAAATDGSNRMAAPVRLTVGPAARSGGTGASAGDAHSKPKQAKQQSQSSAALVHLGGTVLASLAQVLPLQWLHSVLPSAADAGGAESDVAAAAQGLSCLHEWAGAARAAAASMSSPPTWLAVVAAIGGR